MSEYVCALSGAECDEDDLVMDDNGDGLGDLPLGWTRLTLARRVLNPRYEQIQLAKRALVDAALSQMPEEVREQTRPLVAIQIDAQFAALEQSVDEYDTVVETVFISPPEDSKIIAKEFFGLRESLGLPIPGDEEEDD
jgi:hypothetical protein